MRVLISGFEAFGGRDINPTALLICALQNKEINYPSDMTVDQILLPVTFKESFSILQEKIQSFNPDIIISFGEARKRVHIEIESLAINEIQADIQDNLGEQPEKQKISLTGPDTYSSTLPLQGFEGVLKDAGIPVKVSNSAGTFVCNYLFYRLMETNQDTCRLCGFIHVPAEETLPIEKLKEALSAMLYHLDY